MQIMVIPRGVRKVVVHFLVYDPVRKVPKTNIKTNTQPLLSTGSSTSTSNTNTNTNTNTEMSRRSSSHTPNKLRKQPSTNLSGSLSKAKTRDQATRRRSTSRLSNNRPDLYSNLDMDMNTMNALNGNAMNMGNFDGMEIEVLGKTAMNREREREREEGEEDEDEEGEYVVMRRVVKLPRRVWCGRNVSFFLASLGFYCFWF